MLAARSMENNRTGSHETVSLWAGAGALPHHAPLTADLRVDVCVIGAGMAGLSVAYEVLRTGRSVAVLERGAVGSGETGRSTAQLSVALDYRYYELESMHGGEGARLAAASHGAAIDRVEHIVIEEKISCGFERVDGYLFVAPDQSDQVLDAELRATHRAGLTDTEIVARAPSFNSGRCLRFPRQAQMDPVRYVAGLARSIVDGGGLVFSGTPVESIEGGSPAKVNTTSGHVVMAGQVVVATNTPINNLVAVHTKQAAYRSYVITAAIPRGSVAGALYWDTHDPYHYVRIAPSDAQVDWLIVGGEDHKTGHEHDPGERWTRLEAWARERFPTMGALGARWSGQIMESIDGLGYIGKNPMDDENIFVVTGDTGNGITHGAIAGMILRDLISDVDHRWARLYEPSRITLGAADTFVRENVGDVLPYTDWLERGDVADETRIAPGQGAIVRHGLKLLAVYRDEAGDLHRCGAACPHLGGVVRWNAAEKSWDCPCHGSRFDAHGKVMNGPANSDLKPVEEPIEAIGAPVLASE